MKISKNYNLYTFHDWIYYNDTNGAGGWGRAAAGAQWARRGKGRAGGGAAGHDRDAEDGAGARDRVLHAHHQVHGGACVCVYVCVSVCVRVRACVRACVRETCEDKRGGRTTLERATTSWTPTTKFMAVRACARVSVCEDK